MSVIHKLLMLLLPTHWRLFLSGQETVAEEFEALLTERSVEAKQRGLEVTLKGLDYGDQLATQGERDEAKAACIAAYKASLVEMTQARARLLPSATAEEVSDALASPFVAALSSATPSSSGLKAIEQVSAEDATTPVRRGRGRPPGSKNRPKEE